MKLHSNGTIWDGSKRVGEISDNGFVYDNKKHYLGKIDEYGEIYGNDGHRLGKLDENSGRIYDNDGKIMGEIGRNGHITDKSGNDALEIPLFGSQPPPQDWTSDLDPLVKIFLLLLLGLGFVTVAIYCWVQLLISATISILIGRVICKKAFLKGEEPFGLLPITLAIIYIPTLIITLCQEWGDLILEKIICIAGGILVGLLLSNIICKVTKEFCRKVYSKRQ